MFTKIMKWTAIVTLMLAVLRLPIEDYRILLGIVVCVSGLLIALQAIHDGRYYWAAGFILVAVIFNPVVPFGLSRNAFVVLDWTGLAVFLSSLLILKQKPLDSVPSITNPLPPRESL